MKRLLFLLLVIYAAACQPKREHSRQSPPVITDSVIPPPLVSSEDPPPDSLYWERDGEYIRQSRRDFLSIKPLYVFTGNDKEPAYYKMIAAMIDTTGIVVYQAKLSEKETGDDNDQQRPVISVYTYGSYKVKIIAQEREDERHVRLFINNKELKPGKDIDTTASWGGFEEAIELEPSSLRSIKIGGKEYLYFTGYIYKCNGIGCGISYHLLYDPVIEKAMLVDQFRIQRFLIGYDKKSRSPVFIKMEDTELAPGGYAFDYEGRAYVFSRSGKVLPATDKNNKPYYLKGYARDKSYDTIYIVEGNFPKYQ